MDIKEYCRKTNISDDRVAGIINAFQETLAFATQCKDEDIAVPRKLLMSIMLDGLCMANEVQKRRFEESM